MFKRFTNACVRVVNRWLPDAFLFAVILTFVVYVAAMFATGMGPIDIIAKQANAAKQAAAIVEKMVATLRHGPNLALARELNESLMTIENDADHSLVDLLRDLYEIDRPARVMFALRDIYDLCEKIIDRSRDAGALVMTVMLKTS